MFQFSNYVKSIKKYHLYLTVNKAPNIFIEIQHQIQTHKIALSTILNLY